MSAILWGIISIVVGWWALKIALAFLGAGLGLLFGKYVWSSEENKFVEK